MDETQTVHGPIAASVRRQLQHAIQPDAVARRCLHEIDLHGLRDSDFRVAATHSGACRGYTQ